MAITLQEYNQTVNQYADRLYRFVLKSIKDVQKAEDIVQESFEKLWVNIGKVDGNKVRSYLFTTAYHTMIDRIRKEKRSSFSEDLSIEEQSHENNYSDLKEILNAAVDKLPDKQRIVLLLRDYEGYTYKEIAELTELNEAQVKVYIYRARIFMKKYIGKMEVLV